MFTMDITEAEIETLRSSLMTHGGQVINRGEGNYYISSHGIEASAIFDPTSDTLVVKVDRKPLFLAEAVIKSGLEDALGRESISPSCCAFHDSGGKYGGLKDCPRFKGSDGVKLDA